MKTNDEIVEEFQSLLEKTVLYKLENFATKSEEDLISWLRITLEAKDKECEKAVREERESTTRLWLEEVKQLHDCCYGSHEELADRMEISLTPTKTDKQDYKE